MSKVKRKLAAGEVVTMFNPDFAVSRLVEYVAGFGLDVAKAIARVVRGGKTRGPQRARQQLHRAGREPVHQSLKTARRVENQGEEGSTA
jgi:hypothetical protein